MRVMVLAIKSLKTTAIYLRGATPYGTPHMRLLMIDHDDRAHA